MAAAAGAVWGLAGYLALWGYTPFTVHRAFVVSVPGTIVLFPIRVVLWGIRAVEGWVGRPFEFASRNAWIGLAAGAAGAAVAVLVTAATAAVIRGVRTARSAG